jgi:putative FmdB family regulatory protein
MYYDAATTRFLLKLTGIEGFMPLYEYQCEHCGKRFEVIQKFSDAPLTTHDECGAGPVERLLSAPALQFKGTGWYITDYAKSNGAGKSPSADSESTKSGSDSKASSGKTESSGSGTSTGSTPASTTKSE